MGKPIRKYGESLGDYYRRCDLWEKRCRAYVPTPARRKALETGQAIRTIACIDAMAKTFEDHLREQIRSCCDAQMHILGYESLTEHRERTRELLEHPNSELTDRQINKLLKYQRLPNNAEIIEI